MFPIDFALIYWSKVWIAAFSAVEKKKKNFNVCKILFWSALNLNSSKVNKQQRTFPRKLHKKMVSKNKKQKKSHHFFLFWHFSKWMIANSKLKNYWHGLKGFFHLVILEITLVWKRQKFKTWRFTRSCFVTT